MYLYVDSTSQLTLGLLDLRFKFLEFEFYESKKSSLILQSEIFKMLAQHNVKLLDLSGIIYCAGPGSYTGMRVAQGFVDICLDAEIKIFSFYHFQVPQLLGISQGAWWASAFKNEFFWASWNGKEIKKELITEQELQSRKTQVQEKEIYCAHQEGVEDNLLTNKMVKAKAEILFSSIVQNNQQESLYYFRPLEQEFKVKNE